MSLKKNVAYIDGANLYNGSKNLGWEFDYARFRIWLSDKYSVDMAYLFIGMMSKHKDLYTYLQKCGYTLVFKEVIFDSDGKAKGNCDADIVVQAMRDAYENNFEKAVLVSSDGDFAPLVKFLVGENKMEAVLSPYGTKKCSVLLKRTNVKIAYIPDQRTILEKRKSPR